jgi:hypothetical protein
MSQNNATTLNIPQQPNSTSQPSKKLSPTVRIISGLMAVVLLVSIIIRIKKMSQQSAEIERLSG